MKILFVLEDFFRILNKEIEFKPYNYGPYANDFVTLTKPLITAGIVEEDLSTKFSHIYQLNINKKEKLLETISEKYEKNQDYWDILKLIKIYVQYYPEEKYKDLIQFVYYINEDFTTKSQIKDEILNFPKIYNLKTQIKIIDKIPFKDFKFFLKKEKRVYGLLNLYDIHKIENNSENIRFLTNLIVKLSNGFEQDKQLDTIIKILNKYSSNSVLKSVKISLLAIFTTVNFDINEKFVRNIVKFLLSCLLFQWPLIDEDKMKFNQFFSTFKREIEMGSFFDSLPPLSKEQIDSDLDSLQEETVEIYDMDLTVDDKNYSNIDLNNFIHKIISSNFDKRESDTIIVFEEEDGELENNPDEDDEEFGYPEDESSTNSDLVKNIS